MAAPARATVTVRTTRGGPSRSGWQPRLALGLALVIAASVGGATMAPTALAAGAPATAPAAASPPPTRFVTDGAAFLSGAARDELDQRLGQYARDTGHQVLLWIGQTTGGEPIETWAVRAFSAWRVGRKGLDDGVVVFIMASDRKVRIEVGYGLEDRLPDVTAARIIGEQMVPRLRAGDRDGAARTGVSGVLAALGGETGAPRSAMPEARPRPDIGWGTLILLGIGGILLIGFLVTHPRLALILMTTLASNRSRRIGGGGWGGGGWGGGGGGGGGFSGGGGRSGGGGATGSW